MKKIGITGQSGFLGTHLTNNLNLYPKEFQVLPFKDEFFYSQENLVKYVKDCDVIVHLAAMNRHNDPKVIYQTNLELTAKLVKALDIAGNTPHILISSSIHEDLENLYGRSKKESRIILENWCKKNYVPFTGFLFPNLFGPFGDPFYNSFIATFSHQLNNGGKPEVHIDRTVPLLYVNNAVKEIIFAIQNRKDNAKEIINPQQSQSVTTILDRLIEFKHCYTEKGIIPNLPTRFDMDLFQTFRSYIDHSTYFPVKLIEKTDQRGSFVETIKSNTAGQFSYSTTKAGITRGNHFHTNKIERFVVIKGKARIQLRQIGKKDIIDFFLHGNSPSFVDIPIWFTHNITNISTEELITLLWMNDFHDPNNSDTYFEIV